MLEPVFIGHCEELYHAGDVDIAPEVRRKHMALFGTTGAGKSTLMRNMIASDIASGMGLTVVDPHGQPVEDILNERHPDLAYRRHHLFQPQRFCARDPAQPPRFAEP